MLFLGIETKERSCAFEMQRRLLIVGYVEVAGRISATEKETCDEINTLNSES